MFTGLIEETGVLESVRKGARSAVLRVRASKVTDGLKTGDSVAVNGVCLTAVTCDSTGFTADVMHETLRRSSLGSLAPGSRVNLERAMPAGGRFGGHMVAGHVDGTGIIRAIKRTTTQSGTPSPQSRRCSATSWKKGASPSTASASPWQPSRKRISPSR